MSARLNILKAAFRERVTYDLGPLREPIARGVSAGAKALIGTGSPALQARGFGLLMRLHSGAFSPEVDRRILQRIHDDTERERQGHATGLWSFYAHTIQATVEAFYKSSNPNPTRLIGSRILVVKAARPGERGVLVVDYSYVFPLLAGLFDLPAVADRYTIVLEPSWAGSCTPEILLYSRLAAPRVRRDDRASRPRPPGHTRDEPESRPHRGQLVGRSPIGRRHQTRNATST